MRSISPINIGIGATDAGPATDVGRRDAPDGVAAHPVLNILDFQCALKSFYLRAEVGPTIADRGREVRLSRTPLPPNRACGSPAHGSPVSGCPVIGIERNGYGRLADFEIPNP